MDDRLTPVAVVGLGVMGGSLVRALAELDPTPRVAGWSPDPHERSAARSAGVVERAPETLAEAVSGARLVVLAAPLAATCRLLETLPDLLDPSATVVDVASLKVPVHEAAARAGLTERFVGCHPMVGSEARGFGAGRADLYRGGTVWLCTSPGGPSEVERRVRGFWEALGATVRPTFASIHDHRMVALSHLPQLASTALARTLSELGAEARDLGPGGRDGTRLAASNPDMWRDILAHAPPDLVPALRRLATEVAGLADRLDAGDLDAVEALMERTRAWKGVS